MVQFASGLNSPHQGRSQEAVVAQNRPLMISGSPKNRR